jgi:hypothetical protein
MAKEQKAADESVASESQNKKLEHTEGGSTTRDDALDMGVPMIQGGPDEPVGPEDALGVGPKRGDYSGRIGPDNYQPHEVLPASREDQADPEKPNVRVEAQRPRVEDQGDAPGKGGVNADEK